MKRLVEKIVQALADFPDDIHSQETEATTVKIPEIKVSRRDMKDLVGKQGKESMPREG